MTAAENERMDEFEKNMKMVLETVTLTVVAFGKQMKEFAEKMEAPMKEAERTMKEFESFAKMIKSQKVRGEELLNEIKRRAKKDR